MAKLKFNVDYSPYDPSQKSDLDLGIDLPSKYHYAIKPGEITIVETGLRFEFPIFSMVHRFFIKLFLGVDISGVGAVIWPKSKSDYDILAGVVDTGYRGIVKVKIYNTTNQLIRIRPGEYVAQLVPTLTLHTPLVFEPDISTDTARGESGGING